MLPKFCFFRNCPTRYSSDFYSADRVRHHTHLQMKIRTLEKKNISASERGGGPLNRYPASPYLSRMIPIKHTSEWSSLRELPRIDLRTRTQVDFYNQKYTFIMMELDDESNDNQQENRNSTSVDAQTSQGNHLSSVSNLWRYMSKQQNNKAKCNLCDAVLSRTNGTTTGMRKHLFLIHKLECFAITTSKKQSRPNHLSSDEKKKLDSLAISCIVQDGRGFGDLQRPGILRLFNHLLPDQTVVRENHIFIRMHLAQAMFHLTAILFNVDWSDYNLNINCYWSKNCRASTPLGSPVISGRVNDWTHTCV